MIISKLFKHICFLNDFKSNHKQRFDFDFMQIVLFSSISESSSEKINKHFILKSFQIYNETEDEFINKQNFMHQQQTYELMKSLFFLSIMILLCFFLNLLSKSRLINEINVIELMLNILIIVTFFSIEF